jgi:hypothetical protein
LGHGAPRVLEAPEQSTRRVVSQPVEASRISPFIVLGMSGENHPLNLGLTGFSFSLRNPSLSRFEFIPGDGEINPGVQTKGPVRSGWLRETSATCSAWFLCFHRPKSNRVFSSTGS